MIGQREDGGFTLVEVLVAFVIASLALGILYQGALGGLLASRVSGRTEEAVALARAHMAVVGHGTAIVPGERQGHEGGGYDWRLLISRTATAPIAHGDVVAVARGPHVALYAITVLISWQEDGGLREVRLDSEQVGPAPPPTP